MRASAIAAFLFAALMAAEPVAAAFQFSPKRIHFYTRDRDASLSVTNTGQTPTQYVIHTRAGEKLKAGAPELIAYPPVFELKPGEEQTVRLLMRNRDQLKAPFFFRVAIEEIQSAPLARAADEAQRVNMVFSLPLYYLDLEEKPRLDVTVNRDAQGQIQAAAFRNPSKTVARLRSASYAGMAANLDIAILPGETEQIRIPAGIAPVTFEVDHLLPIELR